MLRLLPQANASATSGLPMETKAKIGECGDARLKKDDVARWHGGTWTDHDFPYFTYIFRPVCKVYIHLFKSWIIAQQLVAFAPNPWKIQLIVAVSAVPVPHAPQDCHHPDWALYPLGDHSILGYHKAQGSRPKAQESHSSPSSMQIAAYQPHIS